MTSKKSRLIMLFLVPLVVIVVVAAYMLFAPPRISQAAITIDTTGQPTLGKATAKVQIVAFEDLKCFNCALFSNNLLPKIRQRYIDSGIARYTMFNVAFIPGSLPAANAARCLYEQKSSWFFDFVDYIYKVQPPEAQNWATTAKLLQFAKASVPKADLKRLSNCIIEGKYNDLLNKNLKYADQLMQGNVATPTIYVNGRQLQSFSIDAVAELIKQAQRES